MGKIFSNMFMLGLLDLILLIMLLFYAWSTVLKIIAGLKIVPKYDIAKQVEAFQTDQVPICTLPPNFPHEGVITAHKITVSTSTIIVIILICLLVCMELYCIMEVQVIGHRGMFSCMPFI